MPATVISETFHVVNCFREAAANPRSVQTMLEDYLAAKAAANGLSYSPPRVGQQQLAVQLSIDNKAAGESLFVQSDPNDNAAASVVAPQGAKSYGPAASFRIPLNEIFVRVNTDNNPFVIEVVLE